MLSAAIFEIGKKLEGRAADVGGRAVLHSNVSQHEEPWRLEEELVRHGPPLPLNIDMSDHPFKSTLKDMRSALGRN